MKEINCKLEFSQELMDKLNEQMDEFGQISFENCEDLMVEVMPIDRRNFITEIQPVVSLVMNVGSQIALGLLVNWLYDMAKEKKILVIGERKVKVESKKDVSEALEGIYSEEENRIS